MPKFKILFDEPHEAEWFQDLSPCLADAATESITAAKGWPHVKGILAYDRPDIILLDGDAPILVVEETVEVPSGHNVGQRFARIAAAAENGVPSVYFGPYVARKHGGATAGPRFMNVRLFHAFDAMVKVTGTAVTSINWPVDSSAEVRRDRDKDRDMREYLRMFMDLYLRQGSRSINRLIVASDFHQRMLTERDEFVRTRIRNPSQYDAPPDSVEHLGRNEFERRYPAARRLISEQVSELVLYNVGMTYIRSDPYTGMAMLYHYLYVTSHKHRALVLWFPHITTEMWRQAATSKSRKDIRMYRHAAELIVFSDATLPRSDL